MTSIDSGRPYIFCRIFNMADNLAGDNLASFSNIVVAVPNPTQVYTPIRTYTA